MSGKSELGILTSYISEQVALLFHYSELFRRPRLDGRYLHSSRTAAIPSIPYYELSHVQQKMEEWASSKQSAEDQKVSDSDPLCIRFSLANTRRREQLRYWLHHPFTMKTAPESPNIVQPDIPGSPVQQAASEAMSRQSFPTVKTFSSVAQSAIFEAKTVAGPSRTVYTESVVDDKNLIRRIPKPPEESKTSLSFECPYCGMALESAQMQDRMAWK